jgi:hypothetical protein
MTARIITFGTRKDGSPRPRRAQLWRIGRETPAALPVLRVMVECMGETPRRAPATAGQVRREMDAVFGAEG